MKKCETRPKNVGTPFHALPLPPHNTPAFQAYFHVENKHGSVGKLQANNRCSYRSAQPNVFISVRASQSKRGLDKAWAHRLVLHHAGP